MTVASDGVVCDASVAAAIVYGEPLSDRAQTLVGAKRLLAPALFRYEMANILVRKCRFAPDDAPRFEKAFLDSLRIPIRLVEPSWAAVVEVARGNGLSAYDAAYLQLALELRVPLATLDERLGAVAETLGVRAG